MSKSLSVTLTSSIAASPTKVLDDLERQIENLDPTLDVVQQLGRLGLRLIALGSLLGSMAALIATGEATSKELFGIARAAGIYAELENSSGRLQA